LFAPVLSAALALADPAGAATQVPVSSNPAAAPAADSGAAIPADPLQPVPAQPVPAAPPPAPVIVLPEPSPRQDQTSSQDQIVVTGQVEAAKADPAQAVNEASYEVVQKVDDTIVAPLAMGYKKALPSPVRSGLRNFLVNLTEPVVFINFLLQGKPGKAAETLGRFAINSTVGLGGLIDVAKDKPINLPHRDNGFANTLGYYGVGPGPYLFLPLVGPTTVRDLVGLGLDRALLPTVVGKPLNSPAYVLGAGTIKSLDDRVQLDCELKRQRETSNPYNTAREYYLERRKADIEALHGRVYRPAGHSLIEVMNQCAKENQRAQTVVDAPAEE
jgi:phospholipid-binding lipoprotein MlaA